MLSTLALFVAAQASSITFPSFLSGFKEMAGERDFWTWQGHPSCYVRDFMAHRDPAKVTAQAKRILEMDLWEQAPTYGWHNMDGSTAEPCSLWDGKTGTIYEGWSVQIDWNWGPLGRDRLGHADGWTYVSIHAQCRKEEVPQKREMFRYLFGRP